MLIFNKSNIDILNDKLSSIIYLIEKFKTKRDLELLTIASLFIEQFYNKLTLNNNENLNNHFINKFNILSQIQDMRKFNLDNKNLLISLRRILHNEV